MEDRTPEVQGCGNKDQIPTGLCALGTAELEDAAQHSYGPLHSRSHLNCHGAPSKAPQHPWRQLETH